MRFGSRDGPFIAVSKRSIEKAFRSISFSCAGRGGGGSARNAQCARQRRASARNAHAARIAWARAASGAAHHRDLGLVALNQLGELVDRVQRGLHSIA